MRIDHPTKLCQASEISTVLPLISFSLKSSHSETFLSSPHKLQLMTLSLSNVTVRRACDLSLNKFSDVIIKECRLNVFLRDYFILFVSVTQYIIVSINQLHNVLHEHLLPNSWSFEQCNYGLHDPMWNSLISCLLFNFNSVIDLTQFLYVTL